MVKIKSIISLVIQSALIAGITIFAVIPFSCKVSTEGIEIVGGDYSSPKLNNVNVMDDKNITLEFSDSIKISEVIVTQIINGVSNSTESSSRECLSPSLAAASGIYGSIDTAVSYSDDGKTVNILLKDSTCVGKNYEIYGVVEDRIGNTLTFCIPFTGYNVFLPRVILSEVQIKYGKGSSGGNTVYRGEYVEILALEDGNLAGLEIVSGADGESKKYVFPAIDVTSGEVLLVHLRTAGDGCINEDDVDLSLATAPHSKEGIRDLWSDSTVSHFNDTADIVILRNSVDGTIMDALMYASEETQEWKKGVADFAALVESSGIYLAGDVSSAASSKGCTTLKSLTRVNALDILNTVQNEEEYEYPFVCDADTWNVEAVTPGIL